MHSILVKNRNDGEYEGLKIAYGCENIIKRMQQGTVVAAYLNTLLKNFHINVLNFGNKLWDVITKEAIFFSVLWILGLNKPNQPVI